MSKQHSITIVAGEEAVRMFHGQFNGELTSDNVSKLEEEGAVYDYTFDTKAELDAFILGFDDGNGWSDYTMAENDKRSA